MSLEVEVWERAYRLTRVRWCRNRTDDAIRDAVSEAFTKVLGRVRTGKAEFNEHSAYWIHRTATTYLYGKQRETMRASRAVNNSSTPGVRHMLDGSYEVIDPGTWIDRAGHSNKPDHGYSYQQGTASQIEDGFIEALDHDRKAATMWTSSQALEVLYERGYKAGEVAYALGLTRAAVSRWTNGATVPHRHQRRLFALVDDPSTLEQQRAERLAASQNAPRTGRDRRSG